MLADYLATAARRPFDYGTDDCAFVIANWVWIATGNDPAAGFRGSYSTEHGAERLIRRHGGVCAFFNELSARAGLPATERPIEGDVGVINVLTKRGVRPAGAIFTGRRWVTRAKRGLRAMEAEPLIAWSVRYADAGLAPDRGLLADLSGLCELRRGEGC